MVSRISFILLTALIVVSCSVSKNAKIAGNYTFETECIGVELDGSQTVKAWGQGRNRTDAIEQAKKQALKDVLFHGINNGKSDCSNKALLLEVNAEEKYENYFAKFFTDEGEFLNYVSYEDANPKHIESTKERKKAGSQEYYGLIVRVQRMKLKEKLISDKIIK